MGQPKLYKTQEERALAARTYRMKYYQRYEVYSFTPAFELRYAIAATEIKFDSS